MSQTIGSSYDSHARLQPPDSEAEIMQTWVGENQPIVSICCATYNHVKFIEDAIQSFLAQKTNFPFEIIIRDDASTDGTTDIICDYAKKYPNIIRLAINKENQFKKGVRPTHIWPSLVKGEFCAICEGDDFWISPTKLQEQVELLRKHPRAVMAVALTHICRQNGDELCYASTPESPAGELLGFDEVRRYYFHTSTYMVRSDIFKTVIRDYFTGHALFGDTALRAILITYGQFALLNNVVSVYRVTGTGIWSSLGREKQLLWEINGAKKLAGMIPDIHAAHQRRLLYDLTVQLLRLHIDNHSVFKSISLVPFVCWYRLLRASRYLARSS